MDQLSQAGSLGRRGLSRTEFIGLAAALMALNALAIDIMLPGLQQIGASLGVADPNDRQFVISAYFGGMAFAMLGFGPASDRFGRRGPLLFGLGVYIAAALLAAFTPSFGVLLALRFIQGAGAAATRVIAVSIVRDRFGGRAMAEVMSLVFMTFMIIPVIAPSVGQLIMAFGNWRMVFLFMAVLATGFAVWTALRLPETLHPEDRRPFTFKDTARSFAVVLTNRLSIFYTLATTVIFAALFGFINSAQQIYVGIYGLGAWFPIAFAAVAGLMALSSFLNSRLVMRFGMRRLSHGATVGFFIASAIWLGLTFFGELPFPVFLLLFAAIMFQFGWISSNFSAIAMEPLGHLAGSASAVQAFIQTLGGAAVGAAVGHAFNGTTQPLAVAFTFLSLLALVMVTVAEKGRLFQQSTTTPEQAMMALGE